MKIKYLEIEKYTQFPTRYDLRYWVNDREKWLEISSFEFESEIEKVIKFLEEEKITSLSINTYGNNYQINLENFKYLSSIKELSLDSGSYINIQYLYSLKDLESLWINNDNYGEEIDLSKFKVLKKLIISNSCKNLRGLFTLHNLETLKLQKFNDINLDKFSALSRLTALELVQPKIISLQGIEKISNLKCLTLFYATHLESLSSIEYLKKLEYLEFRKCKNLKNYESLGELVELNRLAVYSCGSISNLNFLKELSKLSFFGLIDTDVSDGDISLLVDVPSHGYTNKKHFNFISKNGKDFKK